MTNFPADTHMKEGNRGIKNSCLNTTSDKPKARCTLKGVTIYTQGFNREKRNRNVFFPETKGKESREISTWEEIQYNVICWTWQRSYAVNLSSEIASDCYIAGTLQ